MFPVLQLSIRNAAIIVTFRGWKKWLETQIFFLRIEGETRLSKYMILWFSYFLFKAERMLELKLLHIYVLNDSGVNGETFV